MMKITAVLLFSLAIAFPAYAQVYYDIDFESPIHNVGSVPTTGIGIQTPSSIRFGDPLVEQGFGAMNSQCLVFNQTSRTYDQIRLELGKNQDFYFLSFDIITRNLDNSLCAFSILLDTPQVRTISFHGNGYVKGYIPFGNFTNHWYDYNDETLMHVTAELDLGQNIWEIKVNGQLAIDGSFSAQNGDINSIRLNLSPWHGSIDYDRSVYVAIDNIYVSNAVPEPCSLILLGLGGLLLKGRKHNYKTQA